MELKKEYFKVLDVLRVWAIIEICLFHAKIGGFFHPNAYLFADFFFILSGFILYHNDFKYKNFSFDVFVKKRFFRLYPLHLAATIAILGHFLFVAKNIPKFKDGSFYTFFNYVFFLQGLGFRKLSDGDWNFPSWAISVEFWSNIIFASFLRYKNKITYLFIAIIGYLLIYTIEGHLNTFTYNYFNFLSSGMVRGLAGTCLGAYLAMLSFHKKENISPFVWSLAEALSISVLILLITPINAENLKNADFLAIVVFALMILYYSQGLGIFSKLLLKIKIHKLSAYVFAAYLVHFPALKIMYEVFHVQRDYQIPVYAGLVILLSFLSHHFIEKPFRNFDLDDKKASFLMLSLFILLMMVSGLAVNLLL